MNNIEILLRLLLAVAIGGLIGYERELNNRAAGFRTHILVCVGAAVTSMIQLYSIDQVSAIILKQPEMRGTISSDLLRLGAQVISGVGFLGVGTIIHEKGSVKGLTTAASLWVVASIGLAVGFGYYTLSIASFICVFLVLVLLKEVEHRFIDKTRKVKVEISFDEKMSSQLEFNRFLKEKGIKIKNIEYAVEDYNENQCIYTMIVPRSYDMKKMNKDFTELEYIIWAKIIV
ncbi:MgtC/SapB family protein [Clostridium thermarum]|uniref:MgtC/SapB family protein n=1 Tax=Clostridium thermarum TaxID=1716543 RepID=UPI0011201661|nr:MgtC/SapB family protein [Clostridium thermarum]